MAKTVTSSSPEATGKRAITVILAPDDVRLLLRCLVLFNSNCQMHGVKTYPEFEALLIEALSP